METEMDLHPTALADADGQNADAAAAHFLSTFLNKTLHLHITDGRMFVGQLKCTDNARNIILAMTQEYRPPSDADVARAADRHRRAAQAGTVTVDMKKRFVGLVVIPGQHITKMEVEE
ncbi:LSM domain [Teratosphaeria destructans]|uniref:LSM domain n=1 Tax=Teratosphaeria destructans TaxID=418781 RepID=A0A9W7W071_9PEZI|nr:LSM domain [Teratosphaeria destructans]